MNYLGDFKEDATIYLMFNTFTSNDPSASCTITNFANTDVHIHKDDGLTQRNNAAGITVSINFDSITGSHMIKIDTSDNTVAGFWVVAKDYFVRIEGTTIDGATINVVVGHFSIENRNNQVDVTHLLGTAWLAPGVAGTPDVNAKKLGGTAQTGNDVGADVNAILTDTGTTLDTLIKDIPTTAEFALRSLLAADYTVVGDLGTVQTGDSFAIVNGAHGLVSIQDDVDAILTDTGTTLDTLIKDIPTVAEFNARTLVAANYLEVADLNNISVADIIAGVADGSYDLQEMMRVIFAVCAGKSNGGGTATLKFRDSGDAKDRVTSTVDANGNRTAMTLDAS